MEEIDQYFTVQHKTLQAREQHIDGHIQNYNFGLIQIKTSVAMK